MPEVATNPYRTPSGSFGIPQTLLEDITLKSLYLVGELMLDDLAAKLRVNFSVASELFDRSAGMSFANRKGR